MSGPPATGHAATDTTTPSGPAAETTVATPWTTGLARFAGLAMALLGVLNIVAGTAALLRLVPEVPGRTPLLPIDVITWGWIHLGVGIVVALAGMAVVGGRLWGRVIGIVLSVGTVFLTFLSLPHHPALGIIGIVLGVAVIWALCAFDQEASAASPTMLD